MSKIAILGASSFIGKHLTLHLSEKKDVELTLFSKTFEDDFKKFKCISGSFEDSQSLAKALVGQDIVYHFISESIPFTSWDTPNIEVEKNLLPFLNFIELAGKSGVKKICFASSGGTVYGLQKHLLTENDKTEPFTPHGIVKRASESFLQYAQQKYQINYDIYRISNVYGQKQNVGKGLGFINTALENILNKQTVSVFGNGENVRDYIYVKDVAILLGLSLKKSLDDSDIYNISSNRSISLNDLIIMIKNVVNRDFEIKNLASRNSDNQEVILDNSKIMQHFKDLKLTDLEEGIKKTFDYLKEKIENV